ncbi:MAG: malate synthase A [Kineosporiaceae bacterium]
MPATGTTAGTVARVVDAAPAVPGAQEVLTPAALRLVALLHERFAGRRDDLLGARASRRAEIAAGRLPDFLPETSRVRADPSWRVPPAPAALADRRVEITGPTDPKMAINALNSGAKVWLADLEDANTPHWRNVITGQLVVRDVALGTLAHTAANGRTYRLREDAPLAVPVVRPRGWHLDERHVAVSGPDGEREAVGALVDVALLATHSWAAFAAGGRGPFLYLPKLESHHEAALWAEVFATCEEEVGLAAGTVRATVLIETLPAVFEMEEILWALGPYATGLNAGRWDYLFSAIKTLGRSGEAFVLPDRSAVAMTAPFLRAYTDLLVSTCHRRGAHAIGGMSAFIPSRRDAAVNERAFTQVRADKQREAGDGFDGSWVAHPDLVPVCREVFDEALADRPNQLDRLRDDVHVSAQDLLDLASTPGSVTAAGVATNVSVALEYLVAWLGGLGAVAIHSLMEDAATAEISRSQVWQWLRYGVVLDTGEAVTPELVGAVLDAEVAALRERLSAASDATRLASLETAREVLTEAMLGEDLPEFLTTIAYRRVQG